MRALLLACLALVSCTPARSADKFSAQLPGTDGAMHAVVDANARLTVVEFFAARCPCQAKHDARLIELAQRYRARGVSFYAIDSEVDANLTRDRGEATRRGYPYPILLDPEGNSARTLRADYATYSLLLDRNGMILFRGGIDSDRNHLTSDRERYLERALDEALAGKAVSQPNAKTLGCSLTLK